jgi:hypothetical protein
MEGDGEGAIQTIHVSAFEEAAGGMESGIWGSSEVSSSSGSEVEKAVVEASYGMASAA